MEIRHTTLDDLQEVFKIYDYARSFMRKSGNLHQWPVGTPSHESIRNDVLNGKHYVCVDNDCILGTFFLAVEEDVTYTKIYDGSWLNDEQYAVVHKVAMAEHSKGVGKFCLEWCCKHYKNVRIDTHADNIPMQRLLNKLEFTYCGIIHLLNGDERIAFHKVNDVIE